MLPFIVFSAFSTAAQAQPDPLPDRDGDGIADDEDKCPDEPEDLDGFQDLEGCPEDDDDEDHVPDAIDTCPRDPETLNGYADDDGCPDAPPSVRPPALGCATGSACKQAGDDAWRRSAYADSVEAYRRACALGDIGGCGAFAVTLDLGHGPRYPIAVTHAVYRFACDRRVKEACHNRGLMVRDGRGVPPNPAYAKTLFSRACDLGDAKACALVGRPAPAAATPAPATTPTAKAPDTPAANTAPAAAACVDAQSCTDAAFAAFKANRFDEAASHAQRAVELGSARAMVLLGRLSELGKGVPKDLAKAIALYRKACTGGAQEGCHNLAFQIAAGNAGKKDVEEARRLYDAACKSGLKPSCDELAKLPAPDLLAPVVAAFDTQDYRGAVKLGTPLCAAGNMDACATIGTARWELGQKKDAIKLWDKACAGKVGWACTELSTVYWNGEGVRKDEAKGFALAKQGCELGDPQACTTAGSWSYAMNETGVGWFVRACDLKDAEGCAMAAHSYRDGDFGPKDQTMARRYEAAACDLGRDSECYQLSRRHCGPTAPDRDPGKCKELLDKACRGGHLGACNERNRQ